MPTKRTKLQGRSKKKSANKKPRSLAARERALAAKEKELAARERRLKQAEKSLSHKQRRAKPKRKTVTNPRFETKRGVRIAKPQIGSVFKNTETGKYYRLERGNILQEIPKPKPKPKLKRRRTKKKTVKQTVRTLRESISVTPQIKKNAKKLEAARKRIAKAKAAKVPKAKRRAKSHSRIKKTPKGEIYAKNYIYSFTGDNDTANYAAITRLLQKLNREHALIRIGVEIKVSSKPSLYYGETVPGDSKWFRMMLEGRYQTPEFYKQIFSTLDLEQILPEAIPQIIRDKKTKRLKVRRITIMQAK